MKPTKILSLVCLSLLVLTSCSSEDSPLMEQPNAALLKTFTLAKNNGNYNIEYTTNNASSQVVRNTKANNTDIYLYEEATATKNSNFSENFEVVNDKIQLNFIDTKTANNPAITIIDDNITFAKGADKSTMLDAYSITKADDGSYNLDFSVKNNVEVDFTYNEEIATYEVHLVKGEGETSGFTRSLQPVNGELRIDFVNHKNTASKGYAYKEAELVERKPRIIIIDE